MQAILTWLRRMFVPTVKIKPPPVVEPPEAEVVKPLDLADLFRQRFENATEAIALVRTGGWAGTPLTLYFTQCEAYVQFLRISTGRLKSSNSIHLPSKKKKITLSKFFTDAEHFYVKPSEAHASLSDVFYEFVKEHTRLTEAAQTRMLTTRDHNNLTTTILVIKDIEEYLQTLGV